MSIAEFEVKFASEVEDEIKEVFQWYVSQSPLAAKKLTESLDELFEFLSINPHSFSKQRKNFRVAYIKKFPFAVVYEITGGYVLILRIIHTSRNPGKRFGKLRRK